MPVRIPVPARDAATRLRLLHLVVDVLGSQAALADALGVARSTVSQWLSAERQVEEWHVVLAAAARATRRHPEQAARLVEAIALEVLDAEGRWVPSTAGDLGDYSDESADVTVAHGRLTEAVRAGDPKLVSIAGHELERETREAVVAARRGAA